MDNRYLGVMGTDREKVPGGFLILEWEKGDDIIETIGAGGTVTA